MSARSASRCELTDTYSPTAIDIDPATRPATPAIKMASFDAEDAATPIMRLAVETIASSEPRTAARNHPIRALRCVSPCGTSRWPRRLRLLLGLSMGPRWRRNRLRLKEATIMHDKLARAARSDLGIMRDHQERCSEATDLRQRVENGIRRARIEAA